MPHKDFEARRVYNRTEARRTSVRIATRAYAAAHKEERRAYSHAYEQANREARRAKCRAYDEAHREERRAKATAHYHAHKEVMRARDKAYRAAHKEAQLARNIAYRATHKEAMRATNKAYRAAYPELARANSARRRARKLNAPLNDLTAAQWAEIQNAQNHCCAYCGKRCKGHLTQDHIIPLSKGGSHTLANVIGACKSCNSIKSTKEPLCPVQPLLLTIAPPKKKKG